MYQRIVTAARHIKPISPEPARFRLPRASLSTAQLRSQRDEPSPSDTTASASSEQKAKVEGPDHKAAESIEPLQAHKTQAQLDEELRQKLAGIAGDGGEAGVEYEDGQPVAMKRSVQKNMFRYI